MTPLPPILASSSDVGHAPRPLTAPARLGLSRKLRDELTKTPASAASLQLFHSLILYSALYSKL